MAPSYQSPRMAELANANKVSEPALITEGIISPTLFQHFLRHNKAYFLTQEVPEAERVR